MQNLRQQLTAPHNGCICHATLSQAAKILPPPGPAPQGSRVAPLPSRRESHGCSRGWAGCRGGPYPATQSLAHLDAELAGEQRPNHVADVAQEAVQEAEDGRLPMALPRALAGQPRAEGQAAPAGFRSRAAPQPSPAPWSYRERAAIQHSAASIQSPQDTQLGSPARQATGQAAESLCPVASIPGMAGSERPWAGSATTGCQHRPTGAAPSTTLCPQYSTQQLPRVESTARCREKTPGWTRAP